MNAIRSRFGLLCRLFAIEEEEEDVDGGEDDNTLVAVVVVVVVVADVVVFVPVDASTKAKPFTF